jgi:hypothetical protein
MLPDARPLLRPDRRVHMPAGDTEAPPLGHAISADRHVAFDRHHLDNPPLLVALLGLQLDQSRRRHYLRERHLERLRAIDVALQHTRHVVPVNRHGKWLAARPELFAVGRFFAL